MKKDFWEKDSSEGFLPDFSQSTTIDYFKRNLEGEGKKRKRRGGEASVEPTSFLLSSLFFLPFCEKFRPFSFLY